MCGYLNCLYALSVKLSSDIIAALVNQFINCARKVENDNEVRIMYHALCSTADFIEFVKISFYLNATLLGVMDLKFASHNTL